MAALDAGSGKMVGPKVTPRTADQSLALALLDSSGRLLNCCSTSLDLPWANNGVQGPGQPSNRGLFSWQTLASKMGLFAGEP